MNLVKFTFVKRFLFSFLFICSYSYSINTETYNYFDGTETRSVPNEKLLITQEKTSIVLASLVGFGSAQGYQKRKKLFSAFISTDVVALSTLLLGALMIDFVMKQVIIHGFIPGDVDSLFNEAFITDEDKNSRKSFYYSGIVLTTMSSILYLGSRIWQLVEVILYNRTLKPDIKKITFHILPTPQSFQFGLTYHF